MPRVAELLAVALAEEAQRDNQRTLQSLDLTTHADAFKSITVAMAGQRQAANALMVPLLDEREPALLGGCLQAYISNRVSVSRCRGRASRSTRSPRGGTSRRTRSPMRIGATLSRRLAVRSPCPTLARVRPY